MTSSDRGLQSLSSLIKTLSKILRKIWKPSLRRKKQWTFVRGSKKKILHKCFLRKNKSDSFSSRFAIVQDTTMFVTSFNSIKKSLKVHSAKSIVKAHAITEFPISVEVGNYRKSSSSKKSE